MFSWIVDRSERVTFDAVCGEIGVGLALLVLYSWCIRLSPLFVGGVGTGSCRELFDRDQVSSGKEDTVNSYVRCHCVIEKEATDLSQRST
jgi:hypothetical protein